MNLRQYRSDDYAALKRIVESGKVDYELPAMEGPLVECAIVLEDDAPVAAVFGRRTAVIDLILDRSKGTPRDRWNWLRLLAASAELVLLKHGYEDAIAFVPPRIERSYGRRLMSLGFVREPHVAFRRIPKEPLDWLDMT